MAGRWIILGLLVAGVGYATVRSDRPPEDVTRIVDEPIPSRVVRFATPHRSKLVTVSAPVAEHAVQGRSEVVVPAVSPVLKGRADRETKDDPPPVRNEVLRKVPLENLPVSKEFMDLLKNEEVPGSRTLAMTSGAGGTPVTEETPPPGAQDSLDAFSYRLISFKPGTMKSGSPIRENVDLTEVQPSVIGPPDYSLATKEANLSHLLSLGNGGEVTFEVVGGYVYDGPGPDLVVFENPFIIGGTNGKEVYAETATVSVSETNTDEGFRTFPCQKDEAPYRGCAGVIPVRYHQSLSLEQVGGDLFDLETLGVSRVRYIRIRDTGDNINSMLEGTEGFDMDAMGLINAQKE